MAGEDKKFISEKIVGRNISLKNAVKRILLALICGIVCGAGGALAFFTVSGIASRIEAAAAAEDAEDADEEALLQGEEAPGEEGASDDDITASADAEGAEDLQEGMIPEEELKEQIDTAVREGLDEYELSENELLKLQDMMRSMSDSAKPYITEVHSHSVNTTWLEDTVEFSSVFAGLIIDHTPAAILVLTTYEAAHSGERLSVVFDDGTEADASLVQSSMLDEIAVLSVAREQLPESIRSDMDKISIALTPALGVGSFIAAVGAPLGQVGSFEPGIIGAVEDAKQGPDMRRELYYADISSDASRGSFVIDAEGRLIGMASEVLSEEGQDITAIVSTSYLYRVIERLKKGEAVPYIGIEGTDTSEAADREGMPQGIYITTVEASGPAYEASIKNGDIVTGLGTAVVMDRDSYENAVRLLKAGETTTITVMRSSSNSEYSELSFELIVGSR